MVSAVAEASIAFGREICGVISFLGMDGGRKHLMPYFI